LIKVLNADSIWDRLLSLGEKPLTERDRGLTAAVLGLLKGEIPEPFEVRRFLPLPSLSHEAPGCHIGAATERDFGPHVDQTNYSVVVDDTVVVKWLTPPAPLPHPALDVLPHLARTGFRHTAPPYAALLAEGRLLALVTGYLPDAEDGWTWCVDDAEAGETAFAPALGTLAADLHLALATLPGGGGAPGAHDRRAEEALRQALDLADGEDGEWLAGVADRLRAELAPLAEPVTSPLIRIHGDLHVGQILRWREGYAVIDFDGNPTVGGADPYQPAARDVAQLTTSIEHVAQVAIKRRGLPPDRAARWAARSRELMLASYEERLASSGRPELLDRTLIRPFEVEQECRELIYAARHLPRWRYAPMGVLRTWMEKQ
jgi:maltokinase